MSKKEDFEDQLAEMLMVYLAGQNKTPQEAYGWLSRLSKRVLGKMTLEKKDDIGVLKNNGSIEPFDPLKLSLSIARASDRAGAPITQGDIRYILSQLEKELPLEKGLVILSQEIRQGVAKILNREGFHKVTQHYQIFRK